jgi:histidinol-phosphatase
MINELIEFENFANQLSQLSGKIIREYFRTKLSVESKTDNSPVTIADKKAEELMRESIMKTFPDHGILGEEFGNYNEDAEYKWVLDPIDGTKSFVCGAITFGTLIALLKNGEPILGVFNQPILNQQLIGDNKVTKLNDVTVQVRACNKLSDAVLLTTDHLNIGRYQDQNKFDELIKKVKLYRQWGDCYGYYLVATGFADVMIDPIMSPWDSLALIPIIKGANGIITDYRGNDPAKGKSIIASSPGVHQQIISFLND